ncbi:MAG: MFS transporter [Helicobacteraceae bacterium]|nr:MFS transporter [Helicobacteraceae bacterium]
MALRFFGLFLVLPILAIDAAGLKGGTPFLAGLAVGGYALMQMIFQYPFGALSDRIGRKKMIAIGMSIFAVGSAICALADSVIVLIAGRFIQGAGAVSAVITATIGDLTNEENRSKAMALMGMSIACSFIVALLVGPLAGAKFGVPSLFWASFALAIPALIILAIAPEAPKITPIEPIVGSKIRRIFANRNLRRLNIAMFLHSFIMTASFFMIPMVLTQNEGYELETLWRVYLPALLCGVMAMGIGTGVGEKLGAVKSVMLIAIAILIATFILIVAAPRSFVFWVMALFIGLNSLEPLMQSSATKFARSDERGSALGVFNACQFGGVFVGGACAGAIYGGYGLAALAVLLCALCVAWLALTLGIDNPRRTKTVAVELARPLKRETIEKYRGVVECYRADKLYVRYDPTIISSKTLLDYLREENDGN